MSTVTLYSRRFSSIGMIEHVPPRWNLKSSPRRRLASARPMVLSSRSMWAGPNGDVSGHAPRRHALDMAMEGPPSQWPSVTLHCCPFPMAGTFCRT